MALISLKRSGGWSPFPAAQPSLAVVAEPNLRGGYEVRRCTHDPEDFKRLCPAMRRFIASLRLPVRAWIRMGDESLELVTADDPDVPTFVTIGAIGGCYQIGCVLPRQLGPWPGAKVTGLAIMTDEAAGMVVNAVKLSGGWEPRAPRGPRRALHRLLSPAPTLYSR